MQQATRDQSQRMLGYHGYALGYEDIKIMILFEASFEVSQIL